MSRAHVHRGGSIQFVARQAIIETLSPGALPPCSFYHNHSPVISVEDEANMGALEDGRRVPLNLCEQGHCLTVGVDQRGGPVLSNIRLPELPSIVLPNTLHHAVRKPIPKLSSPNGDQLAGSENIVATFAWIHDWRWLRISMWGTPRGGFYACPLVSAGDVSSGRRTCCGQCTIHVG